MPATSCAPYSLELGGQVFDHQGAPREHHPARQPLAQHRGLAIDALIVLDHEREVDDLLLFVHQADEEGRRVEQVAHPLVERLEHRLRVELRRRAHY